MSSSNFALTPPLTRLSSRLSYSGIAIMPLLSIAIFFLAVLGNGIDITRGVDRSQGVSISFQVIFRLTIGGSALLIGLWGWWRLPAVRQMLCSYRGWLLIAFVCGAFLSVTQSPEPHVATFVASMILGYTLLTLTCMSLHGFKTITMAVMLAVWLYVLLGWIAYLFFPEIGVYEESLSLTQSVDRMGGLGHPNTLGRSACLATVMLLAACKQRWVDWRWVLLAVPVLLLTLIESKSRSPVIATIFAMAIIGLPLLRYRFSYGLLAGGILAVFAGILYVEATCGMEFFLQKSLQSATKSGSLREITSLTGRTQIWQESIEHIKSRPWLGYGGGSSARIMHEHSGHAHNMLLETALLYGIPITIIVATLFCINIRDSICSRIPMIPEITAFMVILGIVESPMVGMPADPILALWLTALFAKPLEIIERRTTTELKMPPPKRYPSGETALG